MEKESEITCIEDVAAYLSRMCRAEYSNTGHIRFVPLQPEKDLSHEVVNYLRSAKQHHVGATQALGFLSFSMPNLNRLNERLPDRLKLNLNSPVVAEKRSL